MGLITSCFRASVRKLVVVLAVILLTFSITAGAAWPGSPAGPEREIKNPLAGDPEAIRQGRVIFRFACIFCHGLGASGGTRGPDLTRGRWTHGSSDAAIFQNIDEGVPGGLALDARSGEPLASVQVKLAVGSQQTVTDQEGHFN